jgi:hypothetical protein
MVWPSLVGKCTVFIDLCCINPQWTIVLSRASSSIAVAMPSHCSGVAAAKVFSARHYGAMQTLSSSQEYADAI